MGGSRETELAPNTLVGVLPFVGLNLNQCRFADLKRTVERRAAFRRERPHHGSLDSLSLHSDWMAPSHDLPSFAYGSTMAPVLAASSMAVEASLLLPPRLVKSLLITATTHSNPAIL